MKTSNKISLLILFTVGFTLAACFGSPGPSDSSDSDEMIFGEDEADSLDLPSEDDPEQPDDSDSNEFDFTGPTSGLWSLTIDPGSGCGGGVPGTPAQRVVVTMSEDGQSMDWVSLDYADSFTPIVNRTDDTEGGFMQFTGSYSNGEVTENWQIVYIGDDTMEGNIETFDGECNGYFTFGMFYVGPYEED